MTPAEPSVRPARRSAGLWLRLPGEAQACPGCASARVRRLDAFFLPVGPRQGEVSFIAGCGECGLLFADPLPTREELDHYYSDKGTWAEAREERTAWLEQRHREAMKRRRKQRPARLRARRGAPDVLLDALAAHLPIHTPPTGAKVVDVGCGDGKFLDRLQRWGWDTYGIESSSAVAFLTHRRLEALPQNGSVDFVILHHVLEHVVEPLVLLRQVAGALREGGTVFISVPRLDTLPAHRDLRYCLNGRTHIVSFSETCLRNLLARAGLTMTARLDDRLDADLTEGKPLRLRVLATRGGTPAHEVGAPLAPAKKALREYARAEGRSSWVQRMLPVRMRAALMARG